jgi:hypothetical protein
MILQLAAENRYGRGHTFTDIKSLRSYVKSVLEHPAGPAALKNVTLILPAASAEFALNALPIQPKTVIIHDGSADDLAARLRADGQTTVITL